VRAGVRRAVNRVLGGGVAPTAKREPASSDDAEQIARLRAGLAAVSERVGPWTAHNIELAPDVFTKGAEACGEELKLRRVRQLVSDLVPRPESELRVLDLGALEGLYGIELALSGAEVVFIEGRHAAAERIRFASAALSLDRVSVHTQDVQQLSIAEHGEFDVVLCLGLLYHLGADEVLALLQRIHSVCRGVLVLDTHIALEDDELASFPDDAFWIDPRVALSDIRTVDVDGRTYRGRDYREHQPEASHEDRLHASWASLSRDTSFWPTKPSLLNALVASGFTTVLECTVPPLIGLPPDRVTLVAVPGDPVRLRSSSIQAGVAYEPIPERESDPSAA
jgi:2-polyprenyl-3-methyl-5-hydroxy-6-metoxy-1,4-benzoquinol methylase